MHFADELMERVGRTSAVVAGLDPSFDLLPPEMAPADGGPEAVRSALVGFVRAVLEACRDLVPAAKLQSAFFEQFGPAGIAALAESIALVRAAGLLAILDVKRGDIGSTSEAYAKAYLDGEVRLPGGRVAASGLDADAITVNPFLGPDSVQPFLDAAARRGKGVFVLVKTSNPGSAMLMDLETDPEAGEGTVSEALARAVEAWTAPSVGASGYGCVGAVVGATFPAEAATLRALMPHAIVLVPGMGAQGGSPAAVRACFGRDGGGAIVPVSRGLTYPSPEEVRAKGYAGAVRASALRYVEMLGG